MLYDAAQGLHASTFKRRWKSGAENSPTLQAKVGGARPRTGPPKSGNGTGAGVMHGISQRGRLRAARRNPARRIPQSPMGTTWAAALKKRLLAFASSAKTPWKWRSSEAETVGNKSRTTQQSATKASRNCFLLIEAEPRKHHKAVPPMSNQTTFSSSSIPA